MLLHYRRCVHITGSHNICYNYMGVCVFHEQVDEHLIDNFNYVAGIVPILNCFNESVSCQNVP